MKTKLSFKGITIGVPISEISSKLGFEKNSNSCSVYKVTDNCYYSVSDVTMNYARVIGLNGKAHAAGAMRQVSATREHATVFDATGLDTIQAGSIRPYGEPRYVLNDNNSQYNHVGMR